VKAATLLWVLCALPTLAQHEPRAFDRGQSAALFVGVQQFTRDQNVAEVRYAVDDAIDLAYVLALDPGVSLVNPRSVVLALSGSAQKAVSRQRLVQLVAAGATVAPATREDVLTLLQRQSDRAGKDGVLIVAIASHGFSRKGVPYVLTSTSLGQQPETALATGTVLDIASASRAGRALIFLDACRDRETPRARAANPLPLAAAPLIDGMTRTDGHVVLYAAEPGKYSYDDAGRKNGVFTSAVIDALQCKAEPDVRGLVTAESLSKYVDQRVRSWVHTNRSLSLDHAIQIGMDNRARGMPLAVCPQPR
jgi:caspase domain-containing protein